MSQEHRERGPPSDDQVRRVYEARRKFRNLYLGTTIVSFACLALLYFLTGSKYSVLAVIGLGIFGGVCVLEVANWRCPSCNQRLRGKYGDYTSCPYCHVRLGELVREAISTRQFLVLFLVLILVTLATFWLLSFVASQ
jgi:predicted lysophospholipase L1 biosynthesis ABC-type transport system permease subunit